jgi:hypothetical protein
MVFPHIHSRRKTGAGTHFPYGVKIRLEYNHDYQYVAMEKLNYAHYLCNYSLLPLWQHEDKYQLIYPNVARQGVWHTR